MANPTKLSNVSFNAAGIPGRKQSGQDVEFVEYDNAEENAARSWIRDGWVDFCFADPPSSLKTVTGCEPSSLLLCFFLCSIVSTHWEGAFCRKQHRRIDTAATSARRSIVW